MKPIDVTEKYKNMANAIESFIKRGNGVDSTLYRGISVDDKTLNSFKIGQTINQKGISSWSESESTAKNFLNPKTNTPYPVIFVERKGTKRGKDVSKISAAKLMDKNEIIQSAKNKQKIEKRNGITYIYVKEVGGSNVSSEQKL